MGASRPAVAALMHLAARHDPAVHEENLSEPSHRRPAGTPQPVARGRALVGQLDMEALGHGAQAHRSGPRSKQQALLLPRTSRVANQASAKYRCAASWPGSGRSGAWHQPRDAVPVPARHLIDQRPAHHDPDTSNPVVVSTP
jgi:hypothetical protein